MNKSRMVAYISVFTSMAVVGRLSMTILPNIAPVAPLTLLAGYLGNAYTGFVVGLLSMLISDIYIGIGPWTLFTSFFMGLVGVTGSLIYRVSRDKVIIFVLSYIAVLIYDIGTSIFPMLFFGVPPIVAILNLFLPIFFLGIPYPMGPVHEFTSSLLFISLIKLVDRFGLRGVIHG
ncbi:TPA: hypothetical protein EYP83_02135 [Candidatus Geothermarchaeota archaeon]|nr:hypothetical protein [Candidatus Geothermarchaeota archaeon]HIQ13326.1 hypothetical protein [Thermoprotei archaeon]